MTGERETSITGKENPTRALIIPAFNEQHALPLLLTKLLPLLSKTDLVVVVDDSSAEIAERTRSGVARVAEGNEPSVIFVNSPTRSGRGNAVRRGLKTVLTEFPRVRTFLECDADGSHQAGDILLVLNQTSDADVIVGSRYLRESRIVGWTIGRRIQSRALNFLIPQILGVPVKDVTNGLRRYSHRAVTKITSIDAVSNSFIYLSEQAVLLAQAGFTFLEIPIVFQERLAGSSSVTRAELVASARGLWNIIKLKRQLQHTVRQ